MKILVLSLLLAAAAPVSAASVPTSPFTAVAVYDGAWTVTPVAKAGAISKANILINHCVANAAFYTCEQVVNGKSVALVVFVAGDKPGSFTTQVITPNGHAGGSSQLTIDGSHWTFLSMDTAGKPTFKVNNVFTGRDRIHSEQFQPAPDGSWTKVGEQNTVRVNSQN